MDAYDIIIQAGSDYKLVASMVEDLTGYTARGYIKKSAQDNEAIAEFDCVIVAASTSTITITLDADTTAAIPYTGKTWDQYTVYQYDIELEETLTGVVSRILQGKCSVSPEITKPEVVTP